MKTLVRFAMLSAVVCGLLACNAKPAQAQGIDGVNAVLQAHLTGKGQQEGKVQYRMKGGVYRSFEAHLQHVEPGETVILVLRRGKEAFKFAWLQADKQGFGELFVSTVDGYPVPILRKSDTIEIWANEGMVMHGDLH